MTPSSFSKKNKKNFSATECVYGQDKKRTFTALVAIRYFGLKTYYKLQKLEWKHIK